MSPSARRIPFEIEDLPLPGGAVHQHRAPRAHRRAEAAHQAGRQDQVAHRLAQGLAGDAQVADRLAPDLGAVLGERHGQGAEVLRLREGVEGARLARFGQPVGHLAARARAHGPHGLHQRLAAGEVDQLLRDAGGQGQRAREVGQPLEVGAEHRLEQDVARHHEAEPRAREIARGHGRLRGGGVRVHRRLLPEGAMGGLRRRRRPTGRGGRPARGRVRGPWGTRDASSSPSVGSRRARPARP